MRNLHLMAGLASAALAIGPMTSAERAAGRYLRGPDHPTDGNKTPEQLAAEVKADFDKRFDEVKAIATDAIGKAEKAEAMTQAEKDKADEALTKFNEAKARLDELEQKVASGGDNGKPDTPQTAGYQFIEDEEVKQFLANPTAGRRIGVEVKAIISGITTDADGSAGDLIVPDRRGLIAPVDRRMTVRDLLTPGRTSSSSIQYPKETGFTNSAATVDENTGALKPQSEIKFDIENEVVTTIAHWVLATRQILDDAPMLQSYIDGRLRYGLDYAEELQLLHGDGTGTNLNGVYTQATAFADPGVNVDATNIDVIRYAMLQTVLALLPATGIVLHPTDWANIELLKDDVGRYIIGDPQGVIGKRLWGLPVVDTPAMIQDKFLVGAFKVGAQIFDRQDARVEVSTEDSDNFRKNLVTVLAEERLGLAVYRPEAFVKGDFSDAITALAT